MSNATVRRTNVQKTADWEHYNYLMTEAGIQVPKYDRDQHHEIWSDLKSLMIDAVDSQCEGCGHSNPEHLEIDHKKPVGRRGTNDLSNLQILCCWCNKGKGNMTDAKWRLEGCPQARDCNCSAHRRRYDPQRRRTGRYRR